MASFGRGIKLKLVTDAPPYGLGVILYLEDKLARYFALKVGDRDAAILMLRGAHRPSLGHWRFCSVENMSLVNKIRTSSHCPHKAFTLGHTPGTTNVLADAFSVRRACSAQAGSSGCERTSDQLLLPDLDGRFAGARRHHFGIQVYLEQGFGQPPHVAKICLLPLRGCKKLNLAGVLATATHFKVWLHLQLVPTCMGQLARRSGFMMVSGIVLGCKMPATSLPRAC